MFGVLRWTMSPNTSSHHNFEDRFSGGQITFSSSTVSGRVLHAGQPLLPFHVHGEGVGEVQHWALWRLSSRVGSANC